MRSAATISGQWPRIIPESNITNPPRMAAKNSIEAK